MAHRFAATEIKLKDVKVRVIMRRKPHVRKFFSVLGMIGLDKSLSMVSSIKSFSHFAYMSLKQLVSENLYLETCFLNGRFAQIKTKVAQKYL